MNKPDRWERMVAKYATKGMPDYEEFILADHEVVTLLRREHAAVVRMVKKRRQQLIDLRSATSIKRSQDCCTSMIVELSDLMAALDKRRR